MGNNLRVVIFEQKVLGGDNFCPLPAHTALPEEVKGRLAPCVRNQSGSSCSDQ